MTRSTSAGGLLALHLRLALLAPTFWGLALFLAAMLLVSWGAIRPEERFLHERPLCVVTELPGRRAGRRE